MKKKIIKLAALLLILTTPVFAEEMSYQIYVHDIETEQQEYNTSEQVTGSFVLSNLSKTPQSDIYYSISSGIYRPENLSIEGAYGITEKLGPLYIKSNSKAIIPFSYTLPKSVSGNVAIQILATLKDGTLIGQGYVNISVKGKAEETGYVINPRISITGYEQMIRPDTGPTIYDTEKAGFVFSISTTTKKYKITPVIKIYDRIDSIDNLKKTIRLEPIMTDDKNAKETYALPLSTDLGAFVYFAVISFESEDVDISPVFARYVVAGPIATIRNITTESLEVKKGSFINAVVTYAGQPIDEFRPEKQVLGSSTIFTITAMNEKNEIVGTVSQPLDLSGSSQNVSVSIPAGVDAKVLSFTSTIKTTDGIILDEYSVTLPSAESLKNQISYTRQADLSMSTIITIIIFLLLIIFFIVFKKKNKKSPAFMSLFIIAGILTVSLFAIKGPALADGISEEAQDYLDTIVNMQKNALNTIFGYKIVNKNTERGDFSDYFKVTSVSSPLPAQITMYEPGQQFKLTFNATFGQCNNSPRHYWAYAYDPKISWKNQTPVFGNSFENRLAYWEDKGVKILDWAGNDGWEELFLLSDLKAITIIAGLNGGAGIGAEKEATLKKLARTALNIEEYCVKYSETGGPHVFRHCSSKGLHMPLYAFDEDGVSSSRDFVNWGRTHGDRANTIKSILANDATIPNSLTSFDFENTSNLKINDQGQPANDETQIYINKLKNLKSEINQYSRGTFDAFYDLYSESSSGDANVNVELTPVTVTKTYTMPNEPGYHRMYFYLHQDGVNGMDDMTVRQIVCVRGAGVCPNENMNSRPTVTIKDVDEITASSSVVHWDYRDSQEDPQKDYEIQLTTVKDNFSDLSKMKTFSVNTSLINVKDVREYIMTDLYPSKTYYMRMRVKENTAEQLWSAWTDGNYSFQTKSSLTATPVCGTAENNECLIGTPRDDVDTTVDYKWSCVGSGTQISSCSLAKLNQLTNGECSNIVNVCIQGGEAQSKSTTTTQYLWTCPGLNGGASQLCKASIITAPTVNGVCNNEEKNICEDGTLVVDSDTTDNSWSCAGSNGGKIDPCRYTLGEGSSTTTIRMSKKPAVVVDKGGSCTIEWEIKDLPTNTTCVLSGWGVNNNAGNKTLSENVGYETIPGILTNQRYTILCSKDTPPTAVANASVICRVNPSIIEN